MLSSRAVRLSSNRPVAACAPASGHQQMSALRSAQRFPATDREQPRTSVRRSRAPAWRPPRPPPEGRRQRPCRHGWPNARRGGRASSGGAPRAASAWALRRCAAILAPGEHASYTARRTSGWRKRNLRGTCVERTRSLATNSSSASRASGSAMSAVAAVRSSSNGSPATAAASARPRPARRGRRARPPSPPQRWPARRRHRRSGARCRRPDAPAPADRGDFRRLPRRGARTRLSGVSPTSACAWPAGADRDSAGGPRRARLARSWT